MPDFSIILQDPSVRAIVQDNSLERAFHDALFPKLMFRSEATPEKFPGQIGDTILMTAPGLIPPVKRPLQPGQDPAPSSYTKEQWESTIQKYAMTIDTNMPTSAVAAVNLFLRNAQQLGLAQAQALNGIVRNRLYNAAEAGWTVATAQANATATTVSVRSLNGFTKARNPSVAAGSAVRYAAVSANNPLAISIVLDNASIHSCSVTAFTPDNSGDEFGPGTITITPAIPGGRNAPLRTPIFSVDRTAITRVGGGQSVDAIGSNDVLTLSAVRSAIARFRTQNVPEFEEGKFHAHLDPTAEAQVFGDPEWQRLQTSLPDYYQYKDFAIGVVLGTIFVRDSECPLPENMLTANSDGVSYTMDEQFAPELYTGGATTGVKLHRTLLLGQDSIFEYWLDQNQFTTEAGLTGKMGQPSITNNSVEVASDRIALIIRAPLDRLQEQVSTTTKFVGDWPVRTDGAVGDAARIKRVQVIMSGE